MGRKLTVLSLVLLFKLILTGGCGWMQGADKDEEALKDAELTVIMTRLNRITGWAGFISVTVSGIRLGRNIM